MVRLADSDTTVGARDLVSSGLTNLNPGAHAAGCPTSSGFFYRTVNFPSLPHALTVPPSSVRTVQYNPFKQRLEDMFGSRIHWLVETEIEAINATA
jgi:hypothetical protein